MAEKRAELAPREQMTHRGLHPGNPFQLLERFANEVDRMFDDFGLGRGWSRFRFGSPLLSSRAEGWETWTPDIEVFQRGNELVVRADLPGMKKENVSVDVTEDGITISGERRQEHEEERGGIYRSERSYGSFSRTIPVPQGAMADQAKANFKDGVLEITMPAPPEQVTRGRRLEIAEGETRK